MTDITTQFPNTPQKLGLYLVVNSVEWIARLLGAGVTTLQLRIKDLSSEKLEEDISTAISLGKQYGARLFINDYWQLAIKHGAYGVHLGQEDLDSADLLAIHRAELRLGYLLMMMPSWRALLR
jgi:thiamine-phosphate pyrophosphorylase